jgi:hypothetical protein
MARPLKKAKEADLLIEGMQTKRLNKGYRELDNDLQDYVAEFLQCIRYRKTSRGFIKAFYAGGYHEHLRKTCVRIINTIDRLKKEEGEKSNG